jgi:hypothetical protein
MKYDNQGKKWLRVKNWEKYQPSGKLFKKGARLPWIKDYTDKLDNADFHKLTFFQRELYSSVCRLVGVRSLRTVPNDPVWIASAVHTLREERHCVPQALAKLIAYGFLIPIETEEILEGAAVLGQKIAEEIGDREGEGEGERTVSELVSESVSECCQKPRGYEILSERSRVIVDILYPRFNPEFGSIEASVSDLEEVSKALTVSGWKDFFEWNRRHKPEQLVFRSLPKFLAGVIYALNDYTCHDPASCAVCKPRGRGAKA